MLMPLFSDRATSFTVSHNKATQQFIINYTDSVKDDTEIIHKEHTTILDHDIGQICDFITKELKNCN